MLDLTKLKIGSKVLYKRKDDKKEPKECKIIYIFKAYELPMPDKILKYYGGHIINPKYGKVFGPMKNDRIVIKRGKNDYIVIFVDIRTFNYIELSLISY